MTITLVAILCHTLAGTPTPICVDEVVPTQMMVAGKASDPIPLEYTEIMCRTHGLIDALDWLSKQEQYKGWTLRPPIQCVLGQYVPSKRA